MGIPAHLQGGGGHFQWYFREAPVQRYRDLWECSVPSTQMFAEAMTALGYAVAPGVPAHQAISASHLGETVDRLAAAWKPALERVGRSVTRA